jgi:hypothetical protein
LYHRLWHGTNHGIDVYYRRRINRSFWYGPITYVQNLPRGKIRDGTVMNLLLSARIELENTNIRFMMLRVWVKIDLANLQILRTFY